MLTIKLFLTFVGTSIIQLLTHFTKRRDEEKTMEVTSDLPIIETSIETSIETVQPLIDTIPVKPIIEIKSIPEIKIIKKILPLSQTMGKRNQPIKQICLHFTCGGSLEGALDWWNKTPERVSTNYIIDKDGTIVQTMEDNIWAFQLGMDNKSNKIPDKYKNRTHAINIEKSLIGIEVVMEGGLILKDNKFYFEDGNRFIPSENVITLDKPFRDYKYYTKFTDKQVESITKLVKYLKDKHKINIDKELTYDISIDAISGKEGLYSHVNYRYDKQDLYYYKPLHDSLKELK